MPITDNVAIIVGDPHGDFKTVNKIMMKEPADLYLCTGDISNVNYEYETPNCPLWTIYGNHEDWDIIDSCRHNAIKVGNLNFIFPNKTYELNNIRFGGLGGNFSIKYYTYQKKHLPFPKNKNDRCGKADKRRHFVEEEVKTCKEKLVGLDVFLTHESPSFYKTKMRFDDNGCGEIIDDIIKTIKPRLHIWGHHHKYYKDYVDNVRSIGLPYPRVGYLKIDFTTKKLCLINTKTDEVEDEENLC